MKTALLLSAAALLAAVAVAQPPGAPRASVFPYPTHVTTLDNGLKVVIVPMPSEGLAALWSIVRTGSRDEVEPGRTGFAHFFEHMMFRGTEKFPARAYDEMLTKMGADANAFTTDDLTAYHMGIAAQDLETAMTLESDRFKNLSYQQQEFKTEAGAVYGEYRKNRASPFFTIFEAVHKEAFKQHTYGHTTMGYEADIKGMPELFDYSRQFFGRYYRPENVVLLVTGDVDVDATLALVKKHYGDWQPGYKAPEVKPEPPQNEERKIQVSYEGQSLPILWLAYKGPAFAPADRAYMATYLLGDLAFGETSEVYKKLVLDEQVVELLDAELSINRDPGLLDIVTMVKDPAKVDYVLAEIDKAIAAYQAKPVEAQRLNDLKSRVKYGFLMNLATPDAVAQSLARIIAVSGGPEAIDQMYAALGTVTPADVQNAARELLRADRRTVAVLRGES
ncbi:MAG TPA: pitrilysin family protein [Thermoanaerobaculia bacterium]|nr:pitrilysin family protein [Thermoanaerobaculia bacterium]